jgi:transposase InsO family protein
MRRRPRRSASAAPAATWGSTARRCAINHAARMTWPCGRWGVPRLCWRLQRDGWRVNHKRLERLCREEHLTLRARRGRKHVATPRAPRVVPSGADQRWSMDFVHDRLADGRPFDVLTVVDEGTRESPALVAARSLTGEAVVAPSSSWPGPAACRTPSASITGPSYQSGARCLGRAARRHARLHPAGQAQRQCLHRERQQPAPR